MPSTPSAPNALRAGWRRAVASSTAALIAVAVGAVCSSPAAATVPVLPLVRHAQLLSSRPTDGAALSAAPAGVQLTFNERMKPDFPEIVAKGPDGTPLQMGPVRVEGVTVAADFTSAVPRGVTTVLYRVVSADMHPISGSVRFTVGTGSAPPPPATGATTSVTSAHIPQGGEGPLWMVYGVAGLATLLLVVGGALLLRPRRLR